MMSKKEKTTNAVEILHRRYVGKDPERQDAIKAARVHAEIARTIYALRTTAGLSQSDLAELIGTTQSVISRLEDEEYAGHSISTLNRIALALNKRLSVVMTEEAPDTISANQNLKSAELNGNLFPVKEMYKRNWFENFNGSLSDAMACADDLVNSFIRMAIPKRRSALLRQRVRNGGNMDRYALLAWECRIVTLSRKEEGIGRFDLKNLTETWFRELARISSHADGPLLAREHLRASGIPLVFEPHLPRTYLDGAALLLPNGTPVIGMTLRYDRLDNFWFVLFHELVHVVKHLKLGKLECIYDNLDADDGDLEKETDSLASDFLIPSDVWETALARYLRTRESVEELAEELAIAPAIIAGRIRKEADNYVLLTEMIGRGEVRKCFPDVRFGQ
jgi:HTH-type transcriptional regulator / antitoxin HigA